MPDAAESPWEIAEAACPPPDQPSERLAFLVGYAVLAPSTHNSQPWLFRRAGPRLELLADRTRGLPVSDPDDRELTLSCGAALFQLRLALRHFGHAGEIVTWPDPRDADLLARVGLGEPYVATREEEAEFAAIRDRRTHRGRYERRAVPTAVLSELGVLASEEGAWLHLVESAAERDGLVALINEADRIQGTDPRFRRELASWLHPSREASGDGIPPSAAGEVDLKFYRGPLVVRTFEWEAGRAARDRQLAEGSPVLAVLGTDSDTPPAWLNAGQALARLLLRGRSLGLFSSYLNQPLELPETRRQLPEVLGRDGHPQLVLRFGYAEQPPPTPRRPVRAVLI